MKKILFILIFVIIAGLMVWQFFDALNIPVATNFNECAALGNPVTENYPRQCRTFEGKTFVENIPVPAVSASALPADSESPAAGICAQIGIADTIIVEINKDVPSPRCQKVSAGKYLKIKNNTDKALSVWLGKNKEYSFSISIMGEYTIPKPVNEFLAPGVHVLHGAPYNGPEIWLVSENSVNADKGTIRGIVSLGPTCPVVKDPPDPVCADKPYKTTVQIIEIDSPKSAPFATVSSDIQGQYTVNLPAGGYALQPIGGNPFPRCETKDIIVKPNEAQEVNLSCDSGIR